MGDGVVAGDRRMFTMPYGFKWRAFRAIVHQLLSPKMTQTFVPTQEFEIKQFMYELGHKNDDEREFYRHVRRMSFSIMMTSTYGRRIDSWDHDDVRASTESSRLLGKVMRPGSFIEDEIPPLAKLPNWMQPSRAKALQYAEPVLWAKMRLWNRMKGEIAQGKAPTCFGKELMQSNYKAQGLTDEDAAWICGGLIEAGAETSSVTLNNLILHLAAFPAVQARANEELTRVLRDDHAPTFEDVPNLPYIRSCVKEILRLCPVPTWGIKHFADADIVYKQHVIPKGTILLGNTAAIHYDPARYDEPFAFKPERYLDHTQYSDEYAKMGDPYKRDHFTFGVGRRICPGSRLAENTLDMALANLLWAYEIRPPVVLVNEQKTDATMDLSDEAYEQTAFRAPRPFQARFVPRSESRLAIVRNQWEQAKKDGYVLRGMAVDVNGIVH
jgi:cytochrome P450